MAMRKAVEIAGVQPDFLQFNNLAGETAGGKVLFATDEWFAPASNLLKREPPEFIASAFTEYGKWMDGWETRRKRIPGHDWCLIQLGVPGIIHGFDVDTSFFTGNYSPSVSIQAACLDELPPLTLQGDRTGMAASESQCAAAAKLCSESWTELVPVTELKPGYADSCHNYFPVAYPGRVTHLRLNMYPDGGIARLKVYGVGQKDWSSIPTEHQIDLVALVNGGVCLGYSDAHFGHPRNMIGLGRSANMGDGWETARRLDRPRLLEPSGFSTSNINFRDHIDHTTLVDEQGILLVPGYEWAVFRLGHPGNISSIEIDTNHFKGNFPDSCKIEACYLTLEEEAQCVGSSSSWSCANWQVLLPPQKLQPHHRHLYSGNLLALSGAVTHVRLIIAPDGGVSRMRLWGKPTPTISTSKHLRPTSKL